MRPTNIIISIFSVLFIFTTNKMTFAETQENTPDMVMINGKIWTANPSAPYAESIAISGDKILAVGTTEEIERYITTQTKVIDLKQRRVVPGFQDTHTHFLDEALKTSASQDPYTPEFKEYNKRASQFDAFFTGLMHIGVSLTGNTPMDVFPNQRLPIKRILESRLSRGMDALLEMGITTVFELGTDWEHYDVLLSLKEKKQLKIRYELYFVSKYLDELIDCGLNRNNTDEWVKVLGVKFYGDGWLGPRTCALRNPYDDNIFFWQHSPEYKGVLFMDQDKADKEILKAHQAGLKIATHTIGNRAMDVILNAYEHALEISPDANHRHTLEHASVLTPDLIERIKTLRIIPSIQFSFATTDMYFIEDALGEARAQYVYPWKALLDQHILCTGGSDFPIETISPLWGIQRMVTRQDVNGFPEGGWHPENRISVEDALKMITINAAYSSFEEDTKGSIEEGKLADVIVLSKDILEIPRTDISKTKVDYTIVGGEIMYHRPGAE